MLAGSLLAIGIVAALLGLRAAGRSDASGFLGPASLAADINLVLEILLVVGLTLGYLLARGRRIEAHRVNQTVWVGVNTALLVCIMIPSLRNARPGSLADLTHVATGLPWLHAAVGLLTVSGGLWLVLQMNDVLPQRWHVRNWKRLMRLTLAGYWVAALLGIGIYLVWNVA